MDNLFIGMRQLTNKVCKRLTNRQRDNRLQGKSDKQINIQKDRLGEKSLSYIIYNPNTNKRRKYYKMKRLTKTLILFNNIFCTILYC